MTNKSLKLKQLTDDILSSGQKEKQEKAAQLLFKMFIDEKNEYILLDIGKCVAASLLELFNNDIKAYSGEFAEFINNNILQILDKLLNLPHPHISNKIHTLWQKFLLSHHKEAIAHSLIINQKSHILERLNKDAVSSSPTLEFPLQKISQKIGLYLSKNKGDKVNQIETEEFSPFTTENQIKLEEVEKLKYMPICKFLGEYDPDNCYVKLYLKEIKFADLGRDADGINFKAEQYKAFDEDSEISPLHETLAQLLCYHSIKDDPEFLDIFNKLNQYQPEEYQLWEKFKEVSLECIRNILVKMRKGKIELNYKVFEGYIRKECL